MQSTKNSKRPRRDQKFVSILLKGEFGKCIYEAVLPI